MARWWVLEGGCRGVQMLCEVANDGMRREVVDVDIDAAARRAARWQPLSYRCNTAGGPSRGQWVPQKLPDACTRHCYTTLLPTTTSRLPCSQPWQPTATQQAAMEGQGACICSASPPTRPARQLGSPAWVGLQLSQAAHQPAPAAALRGGHARWRGTAHTTEQHSKRASKGRWRAARPRLHGCRAVRREMAPEPGSHFTPPCTTLCGEMNCPQQCSFCTVVCCALLPAAAGVGGMANCNALAACALAAQPLKNVGQRN